MVVGITWLGEAAGRASSVIADRSREPKNFAGIVFEAGGRTPSGTVMQPGKALQPSGYSLRSPAVG